MRRMFQTSLMLSPFNLLKFSYYKAKAEGQPQNSVSKHSLFNHKSFPQIVNIVKNNDNPYPKNSLYYHAILQYILHESTHNSKIMIQYGDVIHLFLQDIMQRIKNMGSKQMSQILSLLRFRPKALRFEKQLLITMHMRFEVRIKQLIEANEKPDQITNPEQILTVQDMKLQVQGLFSLKKNTTILSKVLTFSHDMVLQNIASVDHNDAALVNKMHKQYKTFYQIIEVINQNLDDTIDPVRQSIAQFIQERYMKGILPFNREILRMIVKCKFYKNYPIVRNEDWLHDYVYRYLAKVIREEEVTEVEQVMSVLKSAINYTMHIDPQSREGFLLLIQQGYHIAKRNLLAMSYASDKQRPQRQVSTISLQIKLIPSYLYLKDYYDINTIQFEEGNKVHSGYIQAVIRQIKPIIKKFILCYFKMAEYVSPQDDLSSYHFTSTIEQNVRVLNEIIRSQEEPQKLLLKSVENLLNTITVFKDYNMIKIDPQFSLLLIQTEVIYSILCRQWIPDQVRYLRVLQHSALVISQLQREVDQKNQKLLKYVPRINRIKDKMEEQLKTYDNMEKSYKQFTVLRLVAILRYMNIKPKYLEDLYRNIKLKKPNIYVETLSRTMLKVNNYHEVIDAFQLMFQGKIPVKQIQLGRIVFLSSKEPQLLKYWLHKNRKHFLSKICFCRRIINNIVSIIRMDNLQINRNSIQILSQIVIQNKIFEMENHSVSNHQQSNTLKRILCNNFSILFRYSKMDSMIDEIFIVNKNVPTIFRNKFSHIQSIKILTFSAYLSEEQSIFYVNRQNKNALFKNVIMLMKKQPFCQYPRQHYLLGHGYTDQTITLSVVDKIIQQYWPDNKLTYKGMPFYAQFLNYYTKINKFPMLVQNDNTIFLIIKQILQDFRQVQKKQQLKYIVSRMESNYERLHFLNIFQDQSNIGKVLENVASSMNSVPDVKMFGEFGHWVENRIIKEIQQEKNQRLQDQNIQNNNTFKQPKQWKHNGGLDKHAVNLMIMQKQQNLDYLADYQILHLMTVGILSQGIRETINRNMQLLICRLIKINPISASFSINSQVKQKFPFELFKLLMSNLNIYLTKRQSRLQNGKQLLSQDTTNQKICEWMIKSLLTCAREIQNNEQIQHIIRYMNNWNVDVLALLNNGFLRMRGELCNLVNAYFDVEILSILFSQNVIEFNKQMNLGQNTQFGNYSLISYIKALLTEFQQTHLMNNYGVYFQKQGQKALNIIKSLLIMIMETQKSSAKSPLQTRLYKQANQCLKTVQELFQEFNKIAQKTAKYDDMRNGGRYAYLYNQDQGEIVDMTTSGVSRSAKSPNPYNQQTPDSSSVSLKIFSQFSQILEIISLIRFSKWSPNNFNAQHQQQIKRINLQISKRQKYIAIHSQLTYYTDTQLLLEQRSFGDFGLKLYVRKEPAALAKSASETQNNRKLVIFYIVDQNQSMLYDFTHKKRKRLTGQEQLIIEYIQSLVNVSIQGSNQKLQVQIKVIPSHINKLQLKKLLTA